MAHGWVSIWPPHWIWTSEGKNTQPVGEVGLLQEVRQSTVDPNACFLTMNHADSSYVGRLHFIIKGFVSNSVNSCSFIMVVVSKKLAG